MGIYNTVFIVIISILILSYLLEQLLEWVNLRHAVTELPAELSGIYDQEEYRKSQQYKRENTRFSFLTGTLSLLTVGTLFYLGGFGWLDRWISGFVSSISCRCLFRSRWLDLLTTPFSIYSTFVIEQRYGFNRTTARTFLLDKLKGWLLGLVIGGGLLALITWIYMLTGRWFWLIVLGVVTLFSIFMTMFYSNLIVPLFNKQTS
jgi:STE24 endopeptidase